MKPDFVIIGAMKCGTTAAWQQLRQHPEICGSKVKETNFFTKWDYTKHLDWYQGLFDHPEKLCFESSPAYADEMLFPQVPERMHALIPDAKLIYIVRHPIERMISDIRHHMVRGKFRRSQIDTKAFWITWGEFAVRKSLYNQQLKEYLPYYPIDRILVLRLEDLRAAPHTFYNCILSFLGLDTFFSNSDEIIFSNVSKNRRRILYPGIHRRIERYAKRLKMPPMQRLLEKNERPPEIPGSRMERILPRLEAGLAEFEGMIGRNLGYDLQPYKR